MRWISIPFLQECEHFSKKISELQDVCHDWDHIKRVRKLATHIYLGESNPSTDGDLVDVGALLHDVIDHKFSTYEDRLNTLKQLEEIFQKHDLSNKFNEVIEIIDNVSFSKQVNSIHTVKLNEELKIIRDADRLDAIGAIGIARAFSYGGYKKKNIYNFEKDCNLYQTYKKDFTRQSSNPTDSTFHHFFDKLLFLKDGLYTKTAKKLAEKRHRFLRKFCREFIEEIFEDSNKDTKDDDWGILTTSETTDTHSDTNLCIDASTKEIITWD